jgi:uncharacterized protein (TIGR03435 family)
VGSGHFVTCIGLRVGCSRWSRAKSYADQREVHAKPKKGVQTPAPRAAQLRGTGIAPPAPTNDPNAPPGLFTAIQEQLGLKLEAIKAPVDVMVIDHVDKPSPN